MPLPRPMLAKFPTFCYTQFQSEGPRPGKERQGTALKITYTPRGVCSKLFEIQVEDGVIQSVKVLGGCSGNLQGISSLLRGMPVQEAIARLEGIRCGMKSTSCPDQIAQALKTAV